MNLQQQKKLTFLINVVVPDNIAAVVTADGLALSVAATVDSIVAMAAAGEDVADGEVGGFGFLLSAAAAGATV